MRCVLLWLVASLCPLMLVSVARGQDTGEKQAEVEAKAAIAAGQVVEGGTYINRTAHFTLTVPPDWHVTDFLIKTTPNVIGTVAAPHGGGTIMIQRYNYALKPKVVAGILELGFSKGFRGYHQISETSMTIDGKDADSFAFQFEGPSESQRAPGKMLVVLIPNGSDVLGFLCQAREALSDRAEDMFKKIISSYHYSPVQ
jgi:hypothetical protein